MQGGYLVRGLLLYESKRTTTCYFYMRARKQAVAVQIIEQPKLNLEIANPDVQTNAHMIKRKNVNIL